MCVCVCVHSFDACKIIRRNANTGAEKPESTHRAGGVFGLFAGRRYTPRDVFEYTYIKIPACDFGGRGPG